MYLSGVKEQALLELHDAYQRCYYRARVEQRFDAALDLHLHSKKQAIAFTRHENFRRGSSLKWGDGHNVSLTY